MLSATEVAFVMLAAMQAVLALLWLLGAVWIADERRATLHWAAFAAFSALMFVLLALALRADAPHAEPLRAAGNVSGVLAMLALQRGVWRFIGPRRRLARPVAGAGGRCSSPRGSGSIPSAGWLRVGVNSAVLAIVCLGVARDLHRHARDTLRLRWPLPLALPLAFGALGFAARGLRAVLQPASVAAEMTADSALNVGMAFGYVVLMLVFHATLTALLVTRLVAELQHRSRHDTLTGLLNRRAMDEALAAQLQRSLRNGEAFAVMMIDIDHFKSINDRHGHAVGDGALRHLAALLRAAVREVDRVARYGGEEFVVLLPERLARRRAAAGRAAARTGGEPGPCAGPARARLHGEHRRRRMAPRPRRPGAAAEPRRCGAVPRQAGRPRPRRAVARRAGAGARAARGLTWLVAVIPDSIRNPGLWDDLPGCRVKPGMTVHSPGCR